MSRRGESPYSVPEFRRDEFDDAEMLSILVERQDKHSRSQSVCSDGRDSRSNPLQTREAHSGAVRSVEQMRSYPLQTGEAYSGAVRSVEQIRSNPLQTGEAHSGAVRSVEQMRSYPLQTGFAQFAQCRSDQLPNFAGIVRQIKKRKHFVDKRLKTIWGKRLPITIPSKATYATVLEKALEHWKAFDCHFNYDIQYVIVYDDGRCAQFMPGTNKDFFSLECHKREIGKEYKRITLHLCKMEDYNASLGIFQGTDDYDEDPHLQWEVIDYFKEPGEFVEQAVCLEQSPKTSELLSVELFSEKEDCSPKEEKESHFLSTLSEGRYEIQEKRVEDILQSLHSKFTGEDGIDSGAISKDFLSAAIKSISTEMFPDGSAKMFIFNIQNGNFRPCGELSAISLAQGGHPSCFLSKCSYESLYKEPDLMSMKDSELTSNEINIVNGVRANCKDFEDLIIENDYTGPIREDHAEEIANCKLQNALMTMEDTHVSGHQAAVVRRYDEDDESNDNGPGDHFVKADVSVPDVMRWLTGQSHKPINGDSMKITVDFDHDVCNVMQNTQFVIR
eukprot:gene18331-20153_t